MPRSSRGDRPQCRPIVRNPDNCSGEAHVSKKENIEIVGIVADQPKSIATVKILDSSLGLRWLQPVEMAYLLMRS
jgi:hypothetical protein